MELLLGLFTQVTGHAVGFDPGFVKNFINFSVVLNHALHPMLGEHHSTATDSPCVLPSCRQAPHPPQLTSLLCHEVLWRGRVQLCPGAQDLSVTMHPNTHVVNM